MASSHTVCQTGGRNDWVEGTPAMPHPRTPPVRSVGVRVCRERGEDGAGCRVTEGLSTAPVFVDTSPTCGP